MRITSWPQPIGASAKPMTKCVFCLNLARSKPTVEDSVSFKPSPELQKSLEDLARAVQTLAQRIASDPQIKTAAMSVASGFVSTAAQVVAEQSVAIQQALKTAADKISAAQSIPPEHPRKP